MKMTSKEAFTKIKQSKIIWTIPELQYFVQIEKDLEVLEILKRLLHTSLYDNTDEAITFIFGTIYNAEEDEKIKEWLENDN